MNFKKILALVLVFAMLVSMVPTYAFAEDVELWDEEDVAVQNDAPLEDEYIDEDPVEQEPVEEEPAATDPEEPAAEEPAAEEPAAQEPAGTTEGLSSGETNDYDAIVAINDTKSTSHPTLQDAIEKATDGDVISLYSATNESVTVDKKVTIQGSDTNTVGGTITVTADVTLNLKSTATTSVMVKSGTLSITGGTYTIVIADGVTSGNVTAGTFDTLDTALLAPGYVGVETVSGGYVAIGKTTTGEVQLATKALADMVAQVENADGTIGYATSLRLAVEKAASGATITLLADDKDNSFSTANLELEINKALTIDGANKTIYGVTDGYSDTIGGTTPNIHAIRIAGSGDVTFQNVTLDGFGKAAQYYYTYPIWTRVSYTGKLTLNNVTIKNFARTAVNLNGGSFEIANCIFTGTYPTVQERLQSGVEIFAATGSITGTTMTGMGSTMAKWQPAACVQLGHPTEDATGSVTLGAGNNFSGEYVAFTVSGDDSVNDGVKFDGVTTGTLSITGGTYTGKVGHDGKHGGTVAISGGTFDNEIPVDCCAPDFHPVRGADGKWIVEPGSFVFDVAGDTKRYYTADEAADAVAAAITGFKPTDFPNSFNIKVLSGTQRLTIPTGKSLIIQVADGAAFVPVAADETAGRCRIRNIKNVASPTDLGPEIEAKDVIVGAIYVLDNLPYSAQVIGAPKQYYDGTPDGFAEAVVAAKSDSSYVLKALVPNKTLTLWGRESIKIDKTGEAVTVLKNKGAAADYQVMKSEGTDYDTYTCAIAVASYQKDNKTVYTATFKEAVENAFEIAGTSHTPEVKLYKLPDIAAKDFYAMSDTDSTLTVVATDTNLIEKLEEKDGYADSPFYEDIVTNNGAFVITAAHTTQDSEFTYTATVANASIVSGKVGEAPTYFKSLADAIETYAENTEHYGPDAVIHALSSTDVSYPIPNTEAAIATYTNLPIKVAADGGVDVSITYTNAGAEHLTVSKSEATGYTVYTLVEAVASYVDSSNNKTVYTDTFKKAAENANADGVTLYQKPVISETVKDVYTMTAAGTLTVVATGTNLVASLTAGDFYKQLVKFEGEFVTSATVGGDASNATFTYTATAAVAKARLYQPDPTYPEFEYYATYRDAFNIFKEHEDGRLYLIPIVGTTFVITDDDVLASYTDVKIRIDNSGVEKIKLKEYQRKSDDVYFAYSEAKEENYTAYTLKQAVASIPMEGDLNQYYESVDGGNKYYASFREAAVSATENDVAITLLDAYEIPGTSSVATYTEIFKLESNGIDSVKVKTNNKNWLTITTDEQKTVLDDEDPTDPTVTIYSLSDATPVASITYGGETTYYDSFATAKANGIDKDPEDAKTITLLAPVEGAFVLASTDYMKVEKNGYGDNFSVIPDATSAVHYRINEVTKDGVTTYSPVLAAASIGTGTDIQYYDTFAAAAKAAAGTETITLYDNATYKLGEGQNVDKVIVYKNDNSFSATSGVANKAVHTKSDTEGKKVIVTYTLVNAVASVDLGDATTPNVQYYETFDAAVKATEVFAATPTSLNAPKTIVLLADVTTPYELAFVDSKPVMISVDANGNQFAGVVCPTTPAGYAVRETPLGNATVYSEVAAVASIGTGANTVYYGTLGGENGAITAAFAAEGTEPTAIVKILADGDFKPDDSYSAEAYGSVKIDMSDFGSITDEAAATIIKAYARPAAGIYVGVEKVENTTKTFLVSFHPAVASVQKNDGKFEYFGTLDKAFAVSNERHPVNLLANNMTYALATDTNISPIYVNKNGNEFTVTKVDPESADPAVAIAVKELDDGITRYTATMETVAYVNFAKVVPDGDYGSKTVKNFVYYTSFNDAVQATKNSEYAIVLTKSMTTAYVMDNTNDGVRVATNTNITANITPAAGFEVIATAVEENPEKGIPAHTYDYTVTSIVASVTTPGVTKPTTYHDLKLALKDAVQNYGKGAILTMYQNAPTDFTYPLNRLDKFMLAVNDYSTSLKGKMFTAPEGYYVTTTEMSVGGVDVLEFFAKPAVASVIDEEGEHIFATFTDAVKKVIAIENAKNYNDETRDPANPETVITLLGNNTIPFRFDTGDYEGLKSLVIATGKFEPNLKPSNDVTNFVEKVTGEVLGVAQYRDVKTIATIDFSPAWATPNDPEYDVRSYSSFADAATAATEATATLKSEFTVVMVATPTTLPNSEEDDVYKMSIGTLKVDATAISKNLNEFITDGTIVPVGENVVLSFTEKTAGVYTAGTFSVDGSEAMIVHPGVTVPKYFKTFQDALRYQDGRRNLLITPLTEINVHYTATPTDAGGGLITSYYVDETVNYKVKVTVDGHETVRNETETGRYDFVPAKFKIQSDDPIGYDQRTWEPIYGYEYFADLSGASKAAQNTKVIVAIVDPTTYELGTNNANEVLNIKFTDDSAKDNFKPTSGQTGYGVDRTDGTEVGVYTYSLVAKKTITVNPGDGTWDHDPVQAIPRASIATFTNLLIQTPPTKTGYHVDYYTGDDGNTYATGTDVPAGSSYTPLPTVMPANDLTLTPHYAVNQYWVVFRVDSTDTWKKFTYDQLITAPVAPTKAGSDFQGWFRSGTTTAFDFAHTKFTADLIDHVNVPATSEHGEDAEGKMVLTASFTLKQHTVSFDAQVAGVEIPSATVSNGYGVARPTFTTGTTWSRTGYYDFIPSTGDWGYFDENGNWVDVDFTDETRPTSIYKDYTLVPKWVAKSVSIVWADGSRVLQTDDAKPVGTPTNMYDYRSITKEGYRIDPEYAWIDDNGDFFDGTVPVKDVSPWIYRLNWIEQIPVSFFYDGDVIATIYVDKNMPLSAYENLPKPEDETKAYAWTLKGEDYDLTTPVTEKITLVGTLVEAEPEEPDYSTYATVAPSLSLVDNINMNAYVTIKEDTDAADYAVTVTFNGDVTMEGSLADLATYTSGEYKLSDIAIVAAPQMNDPAVVSITYQGHDVCTADLTVRGYAETWIEDDRTEAELKDLLIALLDFGAYSQLQFNYDTDNLANAKYSSGNVPTTIIPNEYPIVTEGSISSISGANPALTLVSDTTLNMYFAVSKAGSYQFKIDGEAATGTYSRKEYKVSLPKIAVAQLGDTHDFTVTSGNSTMTVTLAPLAYAYQHQSDVPTLGNVCKAVYLYYQAAVAYFG